MIDIKEIEKMYQECSKGGDEPNMLLLPEGLFVRDDKGNLTVYEYDEQGNQYEISPEEQLERIGKARERLGITLP